MDLIAAALLAAGLFVATNIDDAFLLVAWFAAGRPSTAQVLVGQYFGIGLIVAASAVTAVAATAIAGDWVRLLGLLPVAIGVRGLVGIVRGGPAGRDAAKTSAARSVAAVASLTIANGGDNLGVYAPVFATHRPIELAVMVAMFAVMTGLWCLGAFALVEHPRLGVPLRRYGHVIMPFVLMAIGISILLAG